MSALKTAGTETIKKALEAAGQALFEYDRESDRLTWADPKAVAGLLGLKTMKPLRSAARLVSLIHPDDIAQRETALSQSENAQQSYSVEYRLRFADGNTRWLEERGSWMTIGENQRLIGVIRTIDEQKDREAELSYLAKFDELTGVYNRPHLKSLLSERLQAFSEDLATGSYLLVGIDNLAAINADFGFDIADQVIVEVGRRLKSVLGEEDAIGRVAGTKFGIIFHCNDAEDLREVSSKLLSIARESVVKTETGSVGVSVCVGAVEFEKDILSAERVMARAEAALDAAKRIGPSSWSAFSEKTDTVSMRQRNNELSDTILTALNQRQVYLAYQPIAADVEEETTKYECLIRMRKEDGTEVPAPAFIPAAERLGLVHLLDRRVLELATEVLKATPDICLNVNISWETVKDALWAEGYLAHLRANPQVTDRLTIELTETKLVDALEASVEFVSEIKKLGCNFAIDDFGAGYTSFRNLKALDIDILKIDGSFITGLSSSRDNQLFVRTLVDLARNFGMKTVAEWVDNEDDAKLLKALGVDYLQGFFIGKPDSKPPFLQEEEEATETQNASSFWY